MEGRNKKWMLLFPIHSLVVRRLVLCNRCQSYLSIRSPPSSSLHLSFSLFSLSSSPSSSASSHLCYYYYYHFHFPAPQSNCTSSFASFWTPFRVRKELLCINSSPWNSSTSSSSTSPSFRTNFHDTGVNCHALQSRYVLMEITILLPIYLHDTWYSDTRIGFSLFPLFLPILFSLSPFLSLLTLLLWSPAAGHEERKRKTMFPWQHQTLTSITDERREDGVDETRKREMQKDSIKSRTGFICEPTVPFLEPLLPDHFFPRDGCYMMFRDYQQS